MKNIYLTIILLFTLTAVASAQTVSGSYTLADLITNGESGKVYKITEDLIGVYCPPNYPNVIFAKDDNGYANYSQPSDDQIEQGLIFDEQGGYVDQWGDWWGTFDQSNWVKIELPEGSDASVFVDHLIKKNTIIGRVNVQNYPCNPLGLTLVIENENSLPQVGSGETYSPNTYCVANFVMQPDWYLVKPQNQEYAKIHWAVYNSADKKFYVPKKNGDINGYNLSGSFEVDMGLWEQQANVDPNSVFQDKYVYEFPAIIEFRLGETFGLDIDPGFDNEHNIHFAPQRLRAAAYDVGNGGERPYYTDEDGGKHYYTVIVYPLRLDTPGVVTAVEQVQVESTVSSVTYVDMQGRVKKNPTEGMCIEVTRYTDGTTSTRKVVK